MKKGSYLQDISLAGGSTARTTKQKSSRAALTGTKVDLVALCRGSCKTQQPSTPERTGSYPIIPTVHGSGRHWWHGMASVATITLAVLGRRRHFTELCADSACTHTKCVAGLLASGEYEWVINYSQKSKAYGFMASSVIAPGERLVSC
jgi:hypothetical protein